MYGRIRHLSAVWSQTRHIKREGGWRAQTCVFIIVVAFVDGLFLLSLHANEAYVRDRGVRVCWPESLASDSLANGLVTFQ